MFKHYLITAIRNLLKHRSFSFINIAGLSLGIATFLILVNYVDYEFSYDSYLPNAKDVYRVDYFEYQGNQPVVKSAKTHTGLGAFIKENIPEVQYIAKAYHENCLLFNDKAKGHQNGLWADSTFLNVFEIKMLSGDREKALVAPHSMAISRSLATLYFGTENPIGKTIKFNEHIPFVVTAIFEDIPENASVRFNFLLSWSTLELLLWSGPRKGDFNNPWIYTYIKLNPNVKDISRIDEQLEKIATDNVPDLREKNLHGAFKLRPLKEIHFTKGMTGEQLPGRNRNILYALIGVAVFILIAAWINYINLSLAQSFQRAEEIMVRKVYGASPSTIGLQFALEAILIGVITLMLAIGLYYLFVNWLSAYLSATFYKTQGINLKWLGYFILIILITLAAAIFPAKLIAKYNPAFILKRQYNNGKNKSFYKNGLIIIQMVLAIFTIGCTLVATRQLNYLQTFDLGFNVSNTISLAGPASRNADSLRFQRFAAFRNEVLKSPRFIAGTASMNIPGQELRFHDESIRLIGAANERKQTFWISNTDDGYLKTFGLKLIAGRNISEKDRALNNCIINESASSALGFTSPEKALNAEFLTSRNAKRKIVGIIQDFHHESLKKKVEPVIFYFSHPFEFGYYTFRTNSANREGVLDQLRQEWKRYYPDDPFVFYFMDTFFAKQYEDEELFRKLLMLFSIISILVASMGLFGLASLAIIKRSKEISIRKVAGATVLEILMILSREYVQLVGIAFVLVSPIFYYVINHWLQVFSYRIELHAWMFLLPGCLVLFVAWAVVALQSFKIARANPIKSLRAE